MRACEQGHKPAVEFLLSRGAVPNEADAKGWYPLHFAADRGDQGICELLLKSGAFLTCAYDGDRPSTAAIVASKKGHSQLATWLEVYDQRPKVSMVHSLFMLVRC